MVAQATESGDLEPARAQDYELSGRGRRILDRGRVLAARELRIGNLLVIEQLYITMQAASHEPRDTAADTNKTGDKDSICDRILKEV